jgi:hypothetical protein
LLAYWVFIEIVETKLNAVSFNDVWVVGIDDTLSGKVAVLVLVERGFGCCHNSENDDRYKQKKK